MTLHDRIGQLRLSAIAADDDERTRARSGEFTAMMERLAVATSNAEAVSIGRKEMEIAGVRDQDFTNQCAQTRRIVAELIRTVEDLPVTSPFDGAKAQAELIELHFRNSEKFVATAWKSHTTQKPPAIDDELLDALSQAGIDVEEIRSEIETAKATLLSLANRPLPRQGDVGRIKEALDTLKVSSSRIAEVIDPDVAEVLMRIQDGGVPLSDFTCELLELFRALGILGRFRVDPQ